MAEYEYLKREKRQQEKVELEGHIFYHGNAYHINMLRSAGINITPEDNLAIPIEGGRVRFRRAGQDPNSAQFGIPDSHGNNLYFLCDIVRA